MTGVRIAAAGALALLAGACIGPGDFRCTEHAQCDLGTPGGLCEADGHCSLPDSKCLPSRRRYVQRAGADAGACVPQSCDGHTIASFSAGGGHACVARDGNLWCWGRNDHGQVGDGTRTPRSLPVRVAVAGNVSAVAAGDTHTCAVAGSDVFCWGADDLGQLGDGGGKDHLLPLAVTGVVALENTAAPIAAGRDFSCVVVAGGGVTCWGDDSVGQMGDGGATAGPHLPAAVPGPSGTDGLSALSQHACALSKSGLLTCWGANAKGQIGDGSTTSPRPPTLVNDPSVPMPLPAFKQVTTGGAHTCARSASDIYCWGDNGQGQVSQAEPSLPIPKPAPVTGMAVTDPIAVAAGGQHTCVAAAGGVICWGSNASGQRDGTIDNAVAVYAGQAISCALADDGAVFCWGDNHFGQLAIGTETVRATPAPVPGLVHAGALGAGGAHNCATAQDANGAPALFCWGANGSGQLGDGSLTDAAVATRISELQPIGIAAGSAHTCAFPADDELRCWGLGASGQLGLDPGLDMVVARPTIKDLVPPEGGDGVFAVAAGAAHTCVAATISASVLCFGLDVDGQLGNGQQATGGPNPVASFLGVGKPKGLAAGDAHTCAVGSDGTVWCWGRGDEGQLGDGAGVEHASPTMVTFPGSVPPANAIAAGAAHTCALVAGEVFCWGRNVEGQLGASLPPGPLLAPRAVVGLGSARAIAAGGNHTCAIVDGATVSCWGANESGQLGNDGASSSNVPVRVAGLTDVDGIVAGGAHSCAHRSDGTVWCWGANTSGQLGDGVALTSARPLLARIACQ